MKECISNQEEKFILSYNLQWFAQDGEGGEKTEDATEKKLKDARKDGKVVKSKELTAAFDLIVLFLVLKIFMSYLGDKMVGIYTSTFSSMHEFVEINQNGVSAQAATGVIYNALMQWMLMVLPFFIFGVSVTLLISIIQVGWEITAKPMEPKLSKFNPISGFKRIFSKDSLFELFKSIVKIAVIFYIAYTSIKDDADKLYILYEISLNQAVALVGSIILDVGLKIGIVYLLVGIADWVYQKRKFKNDMKMTKQEVKDEFKNTEGDPQIKGRQRRKMQEASQRRMMSDVPQADVIITNPTHLSVAVKYDPETGVAPRVIAKGEDFVAMKIREVAREHNIEIVENKPLARMLYHNVDIGAEIPPELYQAVAEVLAMVYHMKNG